jgi:hypothetical protein
VVVSLAFVAALLVLWLWVKLTLRRGARRIEKVVADSHQEHHELVAADPAAMPWLDARFYDFSQRELEGIGFRFLGNIEDATLSKVHPDKRTYVRLLVVSDGATRAAIFQVKTILTIELLTELADGGCLLTTTAPMNRVLDAPPGVVREHLPKGTPAAALLAAHRALVERHADRAVLPVTTLEEALDAWRRGYARQRARLADQGGISRDELRRIAPDKQAVADAVYDEMSHKK